MQRFVTVFVLSLVVITSVAAQPTGQPGYPFPPPPAGQPGVPGQPQPPGYPPTGQPAPLPGAPPQTTIPGTVAHDNTGTGGVEMLYNYAKRLSESAANPYVVAPSVNPPAGWDQYVDRTNPQVRVNHPKGWVVRATVGPPSFIGMSSFSHATVTSPDNYHFVEGFSAIESRSISPEEYADELLSRYLGALPFRRMMKQDSWSPQIAYPGQPPMLVHFRAIEAGDYVLTVVIGVTSLSHYGTPGGMHK